MKRLPLLARLFILSLASAILIVGSAQASHTIKVVSIDDGWGFMKFQYYDGSSWINVKADNSGISYTGFSNHSTCSTNPCYYSTYANDSAKLTFTGTGVRVYDDGGNSGSMFTVYVDGVSQGTPNCVTGSCNTKQYEQTGLSGPNSAPTVATAASASPSPVTGTTDSLHVLGADDGGEANLSYAWSTTGTPPATPTISPNNGNTAKNTKVTYTKAGSYNFRVIIQDGGGLSCTSSVAVTVNQTLTSIVVAPSSASVGLGGTRQFSDTAKDQFSNALSNQPSVTWSVSGGGSINSSGGLFTAGSSAGGPYTVTAASGGVSTARRA